MRRLAICAMLTGLLGCPPGMGTGGGGGGGGGSAGGEANLSRECSSPDFGAGAAARKVSAFLGATARFTTAAADLQSSLFDVCRQMGESLGMSSGELSGDMRGTCDAVSAKLREELQAVRGQATVEIYAAPPRCEVRAEAYASCAASCEVDVDPGAVEMTCEGGYIYGECSAQCQGECAVDVQGRCAGECSGTCSGGCTGTCQGTCEGTCSSRGADGQCNGSCDGTCHGSCSAGCQGSCEGECWVSGQASCQGSCRGGCSVEYQEPRCTGSYRAPSVSADCNASCEASVQAEASCEPGQFEMRVSGGADEAQVERLRAAFRHFAQLGVIKEKLRRLRDSGRALVDTARNLRGMREAGLQAIACVTEAAAVIPNAAANVSVSVEVSVSVSASASVN